MDSGNMQENDSLEREHKRLEINMNTCKLKGFLQMSLILTGLGLGPYQFHLL